MRPKIVTVLVRAYFVGELVLLKVNEGDQSLTPLPLNRCK